MTDRQALFDQLLNYLESAPTPPDYLTAAPESTEAFDPYQLVSEWIALRQEMKQQGKLLQAAQDRLQRELDLVRSQNQDLQQRLEASQNQRAEQIATQLTAQAQQFDQTQAGLFRQMLNVLDALDRACDYWQEQSASPTAASPQTWRERVAEWLGILPAAAIDPSSTAFTDMLTSNRQGIELIQRNLLDLLKQYQVTPIVALGQPFDPGCMYAIGRQASSAPANTVIQEVVRGYTWHDRILREAQVLVAADNGNLLEKA
ncbi:nucleotide exchange factor GrpE [Pantanalinema rosaneae CENA516]|uniref:nucleotide exchange factor GrpE n=1 Tax=Pantanalinema rosaneae TaxID=1620701 RepID=UPI003D6F018E